MTLRIEKSPRGRSTVLKFIGPIHSADLDELKTQTVGDGPGIMFDLDELTIVDAEVVRFLGSCEAGGVELLNCPHYIREWIKREKNRE